MENEASEQTITARAKRFAVIGALTLWVVCPLLLGAWITVAVHLADHSHVGALTYVLMALWALACLVALAAGFAYLLGGIFFWWRSNHPAGAQPRTAAHSSARADLLRQLHEELRREGVDPGVRDAPGAALDTRDSDEAVRRR